MTNEPQSHSTRTDAAHPDPSIVGRGYIDNHRPAETPSQIVRDGEAAGVSVEVCDGYEQRLCELEAQVEALSKQLESVIMALSRTFGSGQAALQKVK